MSTTTDAHSDYIAHLASLDKVWFAGLRAAGFVKRGNRVVCKRTGVSASRIGLGNGYVVRWFNADNDRLGSIHAEDIETTEFAVREVIAHRELVSGASA